MTVADDLATLRNPIATIVAREAAVKRVEAEIARLGALAERQATNIGALYRQRRAAEAEAVRLEQQRADAEEEVEFEHAMAEKWEKRAEDAEAEVARAEERHVERMAPVIEANAALEAEAARLRDVLRAAFFYYPKDTPMSESLADVLAEDGAAKPSSGIYEPRPGWPS